MFALCLKRFNIVDSFAVAVADSYFVVDNLVAADSFVVERSSADDAATVAAEYFDASCSLDKPSLAAALEHVPAFVVDPEQILASLRFHCCGSTYFSSSYFFRFRRQNNRRGFRVVPRRSSSWRPIPSS